MIDLVLGEGGEMGALMRAFDWSKTPVGAVSTWPQSLRTTLGILLDSGYPMYIAWGAEFTQFYNDAYRPILGSKKHPAALGQPTPESFAEIWDLIGPMFRRVMEEGKNTTLIDQHFGLDRSGYLEECYFTFSYSAIRGEGSGVGGVLVTVFETTERVLEERRQRTLRDLASEAVEARDAEDMLTRAAHALAQNPHDLPFVLLYLTDSDGRARLVSQAGENLGPAEIDLEDDSAIWPLGIVARTGRPLHLDHLASRAGVITGAAWPEPINAAQITPIFDATQTRTAGFMVAGINPRHAADERYKWFLQSIAEQLATALVKAHAYEEEKKRAEALAEIDRAKTLFFSNVSHEFRTPLTLMLGPLEELLASANGTLSGKRRELDLIYRNCLRLQKLVNTLLDFSRIEAGRVQASFEAADLAEATSDIASTFRSAMEKAGLEFIIDCPSLSEPVYVDLEMWEKIVLNLLSNAFKFTLEGSVKVTLAERDGFATLLVEDTGAGIAEVELPRVFERFHRVEKAPGRSIEGTGIGLALIAELVKLHGGTVSVESFLGKGSAFRVTLPFGTAHLPKERIGERTTAGSAPAPDAYLEEASSWLAKSNRGPGPIYGDTAGACGAKGRVLLADDNADMRDYVCRMLSDRYEVETVSNGLEALAAAGRMRPDLIISDVMMPKLDGFGLVKELRASPSTASIPVIFLSARSGEESRVEGLDAGADDYLVKPFTARELRARVMAHLNLARIRKETEERATRILESTTDGFYSLDQEWRFVYFNAAAERMMGIPRGAIIGKTHWELFPSIVGTSVEAEYRRAVSEQVPVAFEHFLRPHGRWISVRGYPAPEGGLSIYFRDVTEQKLHEEQLRGREAQLTALIETAPLGIYLVDAQMRIRQVNPTALPVFGEIQGLIGMEFPAVIRNIWQPRQAEEIIARFRHTLETGEPYFQEEFAEQRRDTGVTEYYRWQINRINLPNGETGVVCYFFDISASVLARKALAESEKQFRMLADNISQFAWVADDTGAFLWYNKRWYDFTGTTFEEMQGDGWKAVHHPDHMERVADHYYRSIESGEAWEDTFPLRGKDGFYRWFLSRALPIRDEKGRIVRWFGTNTDITEQLKVEEALRRANQDLEQFAYSASHDLQEPLRNVAIYSELLATHYGQVVEGPGIDFLGFIREGASRMQQLIHDLLTYTRVGASDESEFEPVDANTIFQGVLSTLSESAKASCANIRSDALPLVKMREIHLQQLLQNLIGNALKYRGDAPPKVIVSAALEKAHWLFSVQDNGIGIDPAHKELIFGIFKRLHNREQYSGTGIGLAICQRIVERYGGRIWVESKPGYGSTFFFTVPA
jgi:PAS domain S-box-containing protein